MSILDARVRNVPIFLVVALPVVTVVGLMWPIHGAVVRLQANYSPISQRNDPSAPRVDGVWSVLKRVKRLEGWCGLFKGSYALLAVSIPAGIVSALWTSRGSVISSLDRLGVANVAALSTAWLAAIGVPFLIIINRSITTPYRLPSNPIRALRCLLSQREYSKPYTMYFNPGLLLVTLLQNLPYALVAKTFVLPVTLNIRDRSSITRTFLAAFTAWQIVGVALATPMEVVATRLSTQREETSNTRLEKGQELRTSGEDVIQLRTGRAPYKGVMDCAMKIKEEEGLGALYKGWWWTMVVNLIGTLQWI